MLSRVARLMVFTPLLGLASLAGCSGGQSSPGQPGQTGGAAGVMATGGSAVAGAAGGPGPGGGAGTTGLGGGPIGGQGGFAAGGRGGVAGAVGAGGRAGAAGANAAGGAAGGTAGRAGLAGAGGAPALRDVYNGIQWADTSGNPIQAHGGGVLKVGDAYYWFGENRTASDGFYAVSCYRSTDLINWEFRHNVLTQRSASELASADVERPKVIYNATTKKYVMWMHWEDGTGYTASRAAVASSDTVDGDYTYLGSARPLVGSGVVDHGIAGYQSRDCTLFVDTDGKAYFISASNENYDLNLYLLTSDYLAVDSLAAVLFKGGHREAPALWKRNNVYFLLTSAATGWDPNQAQYATSSSLVAGWSSLANIGDATTFHSQSAFALAVQGATQTSYLYLGDRWAGAWSGAVNDSTYVWIPLVFPSATTLSMSWSNTLTIDAQTSSVTGATNHFAYTNRVSGLAMSVDNAQTTDGAAVVQAAFTGAKEQQWDLSYDGAGFFTVTNVNSSRLLDVNSSSTADGGAIIQYASNSGDNQKWRLVDRGASAMQLINKHSGKAVEVPAGASAAGTALDQRTAAAADSQLWQMSVTP